MPAPSFRIEEVLPHRPPMVLIDEIVDFDAEKKSVQGEIVIREQWCHSTVAIEYMAQTAAALAGLCDKLENPSEPPRAGFLLGTRKLTLNLSEFEVGRTYLVEAKREYSDENTASFHSVIKDGDNKVVAEAILNAFRPDSLSAFLSEENMV